MLVEFTKLFDEYKKELCLNTNKIDVYIASEHKASNEDKLGEDCKDEYYSYITIEHSMLGEFIISAGTRGDIRIDGKPWKFLQSKKYVLTDDQIKFVEDNRKELSKFAMNCSYTPSFSIDGSVYRDLIDKGFSKNEISDIQYSFNRCKAIYKALAYFILRYNDNWNTIEQLKEVIKDQGIMDITKFTDDDLNRILRCRKDVDF